MEDFMGELSAGWRQREGLPACLGSHIVWALSLWNHLWTLPYASPLSLVLETKHENCCPCPQDVHCFLGKKLGSKSLIYSLVNSVIDVNPEEGHLIKVSAFGVAGSHQPCTNPGRLGKSWAGKERVWFRQRRGRVVGAEGRDQGMCQVELAAGRVWGVLRSMDGTLEMEDFHWCVCVCDNNLHFVYLFIYLFDRVHILFI